MEYIGKTHQVRTKEDGKTRYGRTWKKMEIENWRNHQVSGE